MIVEYTRYRIDEKRRSDFERDYRKAGESLEASSLTSYRIAKKMLITMFCELNGIPSRGT